MAKEIALKVTVDTSEVSENVSKTTTEVEDLGTTAKKTSNEMKQGFKAAEKGSKSLGSGMKNLIKALGVIGIAMAVFTFMKDILSKNQKVMDALSTATTALEIIINKLFSAVEPIGDAMSEAFDNPKQAVKDLWAVIKENLVNRFEGFIAQWKSLGKVMKGVWDLDWDVIKEGAEDFGKATIQFATGLDEAQQAAALEGIKNFAKDVADATVAAVDQAAALVALRNEVQLLDVEQKKLQLTFQKEAELQRQTRDDISLTIEKRQAANDKLGEILDEQIEAERKAVNKRIELAEAELALNKDKIELQVALKQAKLEEAELEERVTSQKSEQLTNQKALEKELFDFQQELRTAKLDARDKEAEELEIHLERMNEIARLAGEKAVFTKEEITAKLKELNDKFIEEDLKKQQQTAKAKLHIAMKEASARLSVASSLADSLGSLVQSLGKQSKASVAIQKTLAIAQIAIDTARSITAAIAGATASGAATGPAAFVATPLFITQSIATVMAGVGQAAAILATVPGGGAPSIPSVNVPSASTAPTIQGVTTNTTELGNTEQAELQPISAFVVETDITGNQNNVNQIQSQSTFG